MGQYDDKVKLQRQILAAEEYKDKIKNIHAHSTDPMYYETNPEDALAGVIDTEYMDGRIERKCSDGRRYNIKEGVTGVDLVDKVSRHLVDSGEALV